MSSILKPSPVPRRFPGSQPVTETNHNSIRLYQLVANGKASGYEEVSSDEDDVFDSDALGKRRNSEADKEGLERRHFDLLPRVRDRFAYLSDPGRPKLQMKRSLSNGPRHRESAGPTVTDPQWKPDAKARRALLGQSTIV